MSLRENTDIASLPLSNGKSKHFMNTRTGSSVDLEHKTGNGRRKSVSIDNPNNNTSDSGGTKDQNIATEIGESKSNIPRHLRKTISFGNIKPISSSKVVLRRWTSLNREEETASKRHSSPSTFEGGKVEKIVFRPVSSILLSTPWEKDFKANVTKTGQKPKRDVEKEEKGEKKAERRRTDYANLNSCSVEKLGLSKVFSTRDVGKRSDFPSNADKTKLLQNLFELGDPSKITAGLPISNRGKYDEVVVNDEQRSKPFASDIDLEERANYVLNNGTSSPQGEDYFNQADKFIEQQNIQEDRRQIEESKALFLDSNHIDPEDMSLSTGSYYYKSKYSTDFSPSEPSYRRGNISSYVRRPGNSVDRSYPSTRGNDVTYASAFKISRAANVERSGKETVAEVEAFISAYKSRRERSFEYGEGGYLSGIPARGERKSSFEKAPSTYASHATRSFSTGYAPTYQSHISPISKISDGSGKSYTKGKERDFTSRSTRYLAKTDRSKSFETEHIPYSAFKRTGSGGRYPRRATASTNSSSGSSTSSSRGYSPAEKEIDDSPFSPGLPYSTRSGTRSILSSDALTTSEKEFFSGSVLSGNSVTSSIGSYGKDSLESYKPSSYGKGGFDNYKLSSYRQSSFDTSNLHETKKDESRTKRPLSLVGTPRRFSLNADPSARRSAILSSETDKSSRTRIMGGILSRFFTEEGPLQGDSVPPTAELKNEKDTEKAEMNFCPVDLASLENKLEPQVSPVEKSSKDFGSICAETSRQSDGDSSNVIQSSPPAMTSENSNKTPSKKRQLVRVKSTFVEEAEAATMGKDKTSQKSKEKSIDGVSKDDKELEQTPHQRERRSSWIGRSLRKISSASKSTATAEEPQEKSEKPKRERRRSLLWRLGRDSKASDGNEIVDEKVASKPDTTLVNEVKASDKKEKSGEKKEERGFTSYLRRSSRRKKSQVSEKEIIEARQEVHGTSREERESRGGKEFSRAEIHPSARQSSQQDVTIQAKDEFTTHEVSDVEHRVENKEARAPLAQSEDSDNEMASVSSRKTRFTEVLRQKEDAAQDTATQRSMSTTRTKEASKVDAVTKKTGAKPGTSYLSSKFMKSKNLFEASGDKSAPVLKKDKVSSKPANRRWTQEAKPESGIGTMKDKEITRKMDTKTVENSKFKSNITERRALFQRAKTLDSNEVAKPNAIRSSDEGSRIPLRERNEDLPSKSSYVASRQSTSKATNDSTKVPVRRLVSDSVVKLRTTEREKSEERKETIETNAEKKVAEQLHVTGSEGDESIVRKSKRTEERLEDLAEKYSKEDETGEVKTSYSKVYQGPLEPAEREIAKDSINIVKQVRSSTTSAMSDSNNEVDGHKVNDLVENRENSRVPLRMRIEQSAEQKNDKSKEKKDVDITVETKVPIAKQETIALEKMEKVSYIRNEVSEDSKLEKDVALEKNEKSPSLSSDTSDVRKNIENPVDTLEVDDKLGEESANQDFTSERAGSRRRRERRAHRVKQVDPQEIEKMKEQMRRESSVKIEDVAKVSAEEGKKGEESVSDITEEIRPALINNDRVEKGGNHEIPEVVDGKLREEIVTETQENRAEVPAEDLKSRNSGGNASIVEIKLEKLNELDTGDESNGSSSGNSVTKITTRSVIKEKIRQKKFDKQLRKDRSMSLPLGVEVVITPPSQVTKEPEMVANASRSPLLRTKPPMIPKIKRTQEEGDISSMKKKTRRPLRSRPKTLTQGIDPSLLISDIKAKEEAVVVEEKLSISQLKERLLQSESGSRTPRTPEVQRKNKRRSGKRYKTITEGIAPGLLEAAQQFASEEHDPSKLGVDQMNKLNLALSASTENLKRRSFIVSEVNSRVGSIGASLATSMEDLSMKENGHDTDDKSNESIVELSIKKLKKLPMVVDSDDDDPMPSVSSLKQRFLQAVEDSYKPTKNKVSMRKKGAYRDRPFTISGIDDTTFKQLQKDIKERHEAENEARPGLGNVEVRIELEKDKTDTLDELAEDQLQSMLEAEGLTADQVASELGINPSLAQGSPLRSRKPFLGTTAEETATEMLDVIEEKTEKHEKEEKQMQPLGDLRKQFMSAMSEFKSGSFDKDSNEDSKIEDTKEREAGIASLTKGEMEESKKDDKPKSDLDFVSQNATQLQAITDRRHLKPQRKQRSKANPVKTLQARNDLITDVGSSNKTENAGTGSQKTSEKSTGLKLWRKVALASEAKAALQSTEDFSKVRLKKVKAPGQSLNGEPTETGGVVESAISNILLKIKGRRHVQIHVVDFNMDSLTSDDSFVVVTPRELFCWHGSNANVIEKAKAAEIASRINQKKEMGCKAFDVVYFEQDSQNESKVFRTLGSEGKTNITDETDDDEEYERKMMNTAMVYSLQDSDPPELVPVYDMCHRSPSKEILKTDEAYVFDFMSEVYVWIGRQTMSGVRKKIMKLARENFEQGYYKPPSNTMPLHHGKSRKISLTATELPTRKQSINRKLSVHKFLQDKENLVPRPSYGIFLSMYEGAEWVIFKEKFCDWPDESRIIRMKGGPQAVGELTKKVNVSDVKPVDPQTMLVPKSVPLLPVFEGTEIDRGAGKPKGSEGYHIITRCVQVWHVTERFRTMLPASSNGHFHSGEGYVIRWEYSIVASRVMKMLKDLEEAKATGRHRCAYFFWLGNDCAVTEQGATAVMTVDLDEERGPHMRVIQGKEPPCFLGLFEGGMIIHAGKRKSKTDRAAFSDRSIVRFYCIRNEVPNEACLLQVPVCATSLRSRSSFVLVLCQQAEIFLWHGCKSSDATKATAIQAAHRLIENHPEEALLYDKEEIFLTEIEEGHEPEVFWVALGGEDDYGSLLTDLNNKWDFVPRCFHLTSTSGQFIANEIVNPSICPKKACPFPFLQDDLYDAYQPAIFIMDAIHEVYLWLGWWPEDEDSENSDALRMRWDVDKRKAVESVVLYAKEAGRSLSHCYVVDAGLEPEQFTHLFPYWIVQEDITDIQIEDGREDSDKLQLITKKLEGFTREYFSIEELIQRPLPEGVNPSKLESYLSDEDFFTLFNMDRHAFKKVPVWRQDNLKKRVGLY